MKTIDFGDVRVSTHKQAEPNPGEQATLELDRLRKNHKTVRRPRKKPADQAVEWLLTLPVDLKDTVLQYATEVSRLANAGSTTEDSYYSPLKGLFAEMLRCGKLPFEVRVRTSEQRSQGGHNQPDLAIYDGGGEFIVAAVEVKHPTVDLLELARSTERNDQIGRYLAQTGVVLLSNIRSFGLLTVEPGFRDSGPVDPEHRRLEEVVHLWPSASALRLGNPTAIAATDDLAALVETAATRYAPIAEPESLARILARLARKAKADLPEQFSFAIKGLLDDFAKALGLTFEGEEGEDFLRSSLIQTAFYGLFAGWTLWQHSGAQRAFRWEDLGEYLKIPFLAQLFYEFQHPARLKVLGLRKHLDLATETLGRVDTGLFFAKFQVEAGTQVGAITYFYEPFLESFDPNLRKELGVWYTPAEIVRYQVRRVDQLLRSELACDRGFADEKVVVLDPCCGTGAYLMEVLDCIEEQLRSEGTEALLGQALMDAARNRVIGFEILTAPFVIAQLQMYSRLTAHGAEPDEISRPSIFLTNALTDWSGPEQMTLSFPELQREHDAAQHVKRDAKIIVIIGNPPYNRFAGVPVAEEADLIDTYKGITRNQAGKQVGSSKLYSEWGIRKQLLNDLYIRFFRLAQRCIGETADYGIVSFISNSSYLTGRSHPIMRESLLSDFSAIWIDNLHGNRLASERTPWGDSCETIFNVQGGGAGIKVGTCISTLIKQTQPTSEPKLAVVNVRDFWGRAERKRDALLTSLRMGSWSAGEIQTAAAQPEGPRSYEPFIPAKAARWWLTSSDAAGGFEDWPALDDLFPTGYQGINPNRGLDGSVIEIDRNVLAERMKAYFSGTATAELKAGHPVLFEKRARYDPSRVRERLQRENVAYDANKLTPYVLFPLDQRWLYYETKGKLLNESRPELSANLKENEFLVAVPQPRRYSEIRPILTSLAFDLHLHDRGSVGFPSEVLISVQSNGHLFEESNPVNRANVNEAVWGALSTAWGLTGSRDGEDAKRLVRSLFRASLALCHAPQYEADHKDSLAADWAHIPIPKDPDAFADLVAAGSDIAVLLDPAAGATATLKRLLGADAASLGAIKCVGGGHITAGQLTLTYSYFGAAQGRWRPRSSQSFEAALRGGARQVIFI